MTRFIVSYINFCDNNLTLYDLYAESYREACAKGVAKYYDKTNTPIGDIKPNPRIMGLKLDSQYTEADALEDMLFDSDELVRAIEVKPDVPIA